MVQPYEPGKIPVLMVHGLWSSPMTWMEMFNDLRSSPEIRRHYQFWFYLYPTGQPFWLSAAQLRHDLAEMRASARSRSTSEPALDQMVLVGHSMGGLVSQLQTLDSGDDYLEAGQPRAVRRRSRPTPRCGRSSSETFFFQPNPSIRRVVTIATPHRGSTFSNQTTQWLLGKLIHLPADDRRDPAAAVPRQPRHAFPGNSLLKIDTSIDSLSPDSPIFPVMLAAQRPPWVKYHNIVGEMPKNWWLHVLGDQTDGVVSVAERPLSRRRAGADRAGGHMTVHCHPLAVMEVRRILHEHLDELRGHPVVGLRILPPVR